jgi:hypothetical protein
VVCSSSVMCQICEEVDGDGQNCKERAVLIALGILLINDTVLLLGLF